MLTLDRRCGDSNLSDDRRCRSEQPFEMRFGLVQSQPTERRDESSGHLWRFRPRFQNCERAIVIRAFERQHSCGEDIARLASANGPFTKLPPGFARDPQSVQVSLDAQIELRQIAKVVVRSPDGVTPKLPEE